MESTDTWHISFVTWNTEQYSVRKCHMSHVFILFNVRKLHNLKSYYRRRLLNTVCLLELLKLFLETWHTNPGVI